MANEEILLKLSDNIVAKQEQFGFASLNEVEQAFFCIWELERYVNQGGFDHFYFYSAGDYAHETVDALETIGAAHIAQTVARANAVFGPSGPPSDIDERQEQVENFPNHKQKRSNNLTANSWSMRTI